jgi:REP element-mobilizing transposase RayT
MSIEEVLKHRRSVRLPVYDYTSPGAYFITVCTYDRACLFDDRRLRAIVEKVWRWTTKSNREAAGVDYVVMPNHVHGIVWIHERKAVGAQHKPLQEHRDGQLTAAVTFGRDKSPDAAPLRPAPDRQFVVQKRSLAAIVRTFKSVAAQRVNGVRGTPGGPVWQRNYYEHIIRSEAELGSIREYISNNPLKWQLDRENPDRVPDAAYDREWEWLEGAAVARSKDGH